MSAIDDVITRITQLQGMTPATIGSPELRAALAATGISPIGGPTFADALANAAATPAAATSASGTSIVSAAEGQLGQAEQPPGSNDGPAIATYRSAVAGAEAGAPWCAYFVSWAAQQAGEPLGDNGQGIGSVAGITDWAKQNNRLLPANWTPKSGDLILFGTRHVGIVESVNPDGSIVSIEGNSGNAVSRVTHKAGEATGFVSMG